MDSSKQSDENIIREPIRMPGKAVRRNDLCFCGSGKKYKRCHREIGRTLRLVPKQQQQQ
jgi:uncharacterized protein YecA (UPF0149 family)